MAEDQQDDSQKTEEPTEKRLREAREKGDVAKSQEVGHWFMILGFTLIVAFLLPGMANDIGLAMLPFFERPHLMRVDSRSIEGVLSEASWDVASALLLPMAILVAAAILSGLLQTGVLFSAERMKPKLEKISLIRGFTRQFSMKALAEFLKGVFKLTVVGAVIALVLWPEKDTIPQITTLEMPQFASHVVWLSLKVLIAALAVMTVIAALDFLFQRQQHMKQMRMSKQELKDEYKQTEGDPMIKARLRQIRTERARQRMMSAVPESDVVVTNPTHFAVALRYRHGEDQAPRVTAKGADNIAFKIREIAEAHEIPIVENPPLARTLFDGVELDQEVPPEHYQAVAEVISYVMRLKGNAPRAEARP